MGIIIDKEFQALIPPLSDDEFRQLEENCIRDGIRDPLVTWPQDDGTEILIDGHNRWKISAKNAGIPFKIVHMRFENRDDAIVWIITNQLGRRNIQPYARIEIVEQKLKPIIAKKAKQRMLIAPQISAEREREINKIWADHDYDTARNLVAMKKQEYAKEKRRESMRKGKYIYFARINEDQIKVGSSTAPEERIKHLSIACPGIELIESVLYGVGAEKHENALKKKFSEYRVGNECYRCSDDVLRKMISFTKKEAARDNNTNYELARIAGVSHDTVRKVETIMKHGTPEIQAKARNGEISIEKAFQQTANIIRPLKKTDPAKEAEEQHAEYQQKKDSGIVSVTDAAVDKENRRILALELSKRVTRAINAAQDISLLKGDQKSIIAELTPEEQGDIRMQLEKLISMLVALNAQIGGANGKV